MGPPPPGLPESRIDRTLPLPGLPPLPPRPEDEMVSTQPVPAEATLPGGPLEPSQPVAPQASPDAGVPSEEASAEPEAPTAPVLTGLEENFPTPITPSAGCARGDPEPPRGLAALSIRGMPAEYLLQLPESYTGSEPVPLVFAFHGRARTYLELPGEDAQDLPLELGQRALLVFPQSQGGEGWTQPEELGPSLEFFEALYAQLMDGYCIDRSRVFALGHSSGGFFSHVLACRHGDLLRGIGVVAGALEADAFAGVECNGYVAALLIHGVRDSVVEFARGLTARDFYLRRNGCSSAGAGAELGSCRSYDGCEAGLPIAWCEHDEPTYDDTNHGWPSFASRAIAEFLFALP